MMKNYDELIQKISDSKEGYILNHYRKKKFQDKFILTTDSGSWACIDENDYEKFVKKEINQELYKELSSNGIILDKENIQKYIENSRKKMCFLFRGTSLHIVVPTLRCNIKCAYCHSSSRPVSSKGFDMDLQTAKKTVDFIFQSPNQYITIEFQGGEPLLRFDLIKYIIEYAEKLNQSMKKDLVFTIVTNLILMDEEKLEYFKKHKINICTSLDGPKSLHDSNRQRYDETSKWIKKIKEGYNLNAMPIMNRKSLGKEKEIIDEYVRLGLKTIWIKPLNSLGFATDDWDNLGIEPEEFLDSFKKSLKYIVEVNKKSMLLERFTLIVLKKMLSEYSANFLDIQSPCGAAIGQLAYNYDGSIYCCDEGRFFEIFKLGTVDNSYKEIICSPSTCSIAQSSINDNAVCEICAYKPFCGLCPVMSYAETGNLISKIPNRKCTILKGVFDHIFEKFLFDKEYKEVFLAWYNNSEKYL